MSIQASDIKAYGSAVMPDDDSVNNIGGAIDTSKKVEFTDIAPAGTVEMSSDNAGDTTQSVTVYGRNNAGELVNEAKTLNGTTWVAFTTTFERILKVVMSAAATGTVTIRETGPGDDLVTMEPGITEVRRPFYNASAPASGTRKYYEKIFFKNDHATLTLTSAVIKENADPSGKIAFALETSLDGTDTNGGGNNRQVAPSGYTFDSADKNVANSQNHSAGSAQGVWMELSLAAGDPAQNTTYTLREEGNST